MIRNEREYQEAVQRLQDERARLAAYAVELEGGGMVREAVDRAMNPLRSFHRQLAEAVEYYERLKRGDPGTLPNLHGLGWMSRWCPAMSATSITAPASSGRFACSMPWACSW